MMLCAENIVISVEISTTGFHICKNKQDQYGEIKFRIMEDGHHASFQRLYNVRNSLDQVPKHNYLKPS